MKNFVQEDDNILLTAGSGKVSGDPVIVGNIPAVCITDVDANNQCACRVNGVFSLAVLGEDGVGNSAVAEGDIVYMDSGVLNVDDTNGVKFGYALGAVGSGLTATINVLLAK
jgi:predicted RecA/RadA family phage recombinase